MRLNVLPYTLILALVSGDAVAHRTRPTHGHVHVNLLSGTGAGCMSPAPPGLTARPGENWQRYRERALRQLNAFNQQLAAQDACIKAAPPRVLNGDVITSGGFGENVHMLTSIMKVHGDIRRAEIALGTPENQWIIPHSENLFAPVKEILATPLTDPSGWVVQEDFPAQASRSDIKGPLSYRISVDPDGSPRDCNIEQSSGSTALDRATCTALINRARFTPIREATGLAIYRSSIRW